MDEFYADYSRAIKYAAEATSDTGPLVAAVLNPRRKYEIDQTALGALGDHLQEIGSPAGKAISHIVGGGKRAGYRSLNTDASENLSVIHGGKKYQILTRHGHDFDDNPIVWVSLSRWKRRQQIGPYADDKSLPDLWDKEKSHELAVPRNIVFDANTSAT
jgi:hypothetical protein